jgi:hypothetical protein
MDTIGCGAQDAGIRFRFGFRLGFGIIVAEAAAAQGIIPTMEGTTEPTI